MPTDPHPPRRRRWPLILGGVVAALAAAEGGARWLAREVVPIRFVQLGEGIRGRPQERFLRFIRSDPDLFWSLTPHTRAPDHERPFFGVIANGAGFREDREIPVARPAGEARVLFLGDSCTFGYLVHAHEAYPARVVVRLRAAGVAVEGINAGVPGYTLFQGWRRLVTQALAYAPDVVVLAFGWNEMTPADGLSDLEHHARWRAAQPPGLLQASALLRAVWRASATFAGDAARPNRPRLVPEEFRALLASCRDACRGAGAELVVLVLGSRQQALAEDGRIERTPLQQEQIRFVAQAAGEGPRPRSVDVITAGAALARAQGVDAVFFDDVHPTVRMHDRIAEELAPVLDALLRGRAGQRPTNK